MELVEGEEKVSAVEDALSFEAGFAVNFAAGCQRPISQALESS